MIQMKERTREQKRFRKEKIVDLIFVLIAVVFLAVMIFLLSEYNQLREGNEARPAEYQQIMDEFTDVKNRKNTLESRIENIRQEIEDMNKKISQLTD